MIEYQQKSLFFKNMSSKNTDRELHYIFIQQGKKVFRTTVIIQLLTEEN